MNGANIGRLIRLMRTEKKLGQVALAQAAGISQSTLSAMENGAALTADNLARVANALGTTAGRLLDAAARIDERSEADKRAIALADDLARLMDPAEMDALFAKAAGNRPVMTPPVRIPKPSPTGRTEGHAAPERLGWAEGHRRIKIQATIELEETKIGNRTVYVYKGADVQGPVQAVKKVKAAFGKMMKPSKPLQTKRASS